MTTNTIHYTTEGSVRGGCGHKHKTLRTANACVSADSRACHQQGGYSDRKVVPADGRELTDDEMHTLDALGDY